VRLRNRILCGVAILLASEMACRAAWALRGPTGLLRPALIRSFYPELAHVQDWPIRRENESLDVLLLGGSVLHPDWGFVRELLYEELQCRTRKPVYVHNLARGGHTTLDSRRKYEAITEQTFDVVVVYHGINDTRLNNCPRERFAPDYSQLLWYAQLDSLLRHPEASWCTIPYSAAYLARALGAATGVLDFLPANRPDARWLDHGGDLKSVVPFAANLRSVVGRAQARGDRVLLLTFAWYLPDDYSEERFWRHELDYCGNGSAVELWGRPADVAAGIRAHNAIVRGIAAELAVPMVDLERLIPRNGAMFHDICHFTGRGAAAFVANVVDPVLAESGHAR
jgi:hypothetical protein